MALAGGDDAKDRVFQIIDALVDRVGFDKGFDGSQLVFQTCLDLGARHIRAAYMQTAGRWGELRQRECAVRLQRHGLSAFNRFRDRLEADPCAGKTAQREPVGPEFKKLPHVCGVKRGHHPRHERHIGLMRHRRRHAPVVVPRNNQNAALGRRPVGVAVAQCIARPVHSRPLAIPHVEHALHLTMRIKHGLLRP